NVKDFLEQCLISVGKALRGVQGEILVVDNFSSDGSADLVREKFPSVKLIVNPKNLGFARASNQGIALARGEYIALLNPDTIVQEDTFSKMVAFLNDHPETGMLGCKILNPDGSLQLACRRSFPTPWVAFTKLSGLSRVFPKSKFFGRYNLTYLDPDASYEVDAISGSFMMIRRKVLEDVGTLDEAFFMYGEDLDWCFRIREKGWQVSYFPATQIIHFKGESSKRAQFDSLRQFYQAMALFARKHFRRKYLLMPYWLLRAAIWFRAGVSFVSSLANGLAVLLVDFVFLASSLVLALFIRFGNLEHLPSFLLVITFYILAWIFLLKLFGCYDRDKFSVSRASFAVLIGFLVNASLTFFFNQYAFSRAVVLIGSMLSFATVSGWRLLVQILSALGWLTLNTSCAKNTIIVGDLTSGQELAKKFDALVNSNYKIAGLVCPGRISSVHEAGGAKVLGTLDGIDSIIRDNHIQEVIFATNELSYDQILAVISNTASQRVNFKLAPGNLEVVIGKASVDRFDEVPLLEIDYRLHQIQYRALKRAFDFGLAVLLFLLTLPLFLYKKILTSSRLRTRLFWGRNESRVCVYEFAGDDSKLNKIPYLWAIMKGEVSFVGKELTEVSDHADSSPFQNVDLKPGIVSLSRMASRANPGKDERRKYHHYYMKNYSPFLDMEILFKTLRKPGLSDD
ncbi:MAG: glycosyltransferase, partial [bacterium]